MNFEDALNHFTEISIQELITKIENEGKVIAFLGRETCGFCRRFAPKLAQISQEYDLTVYYIASDNIDDMALLSRFRELHNIPTVPALVVTDQGTIRRICDSSLSEEAIATFIDA